MTVRVMIDIETLGGSPNGVVTQIGLVRNGPAEVEQCCIRTLDLRKALGTIETGTLAWWATQDKDLFVDTLKGLHHPFDAHEAMVLMMRGADEIWANSPTFDLTIMRDWCGRYGYNVPWHYRQERDIRTLYNLRKWDFTGVPTVEGAAHNALVDAKRQMGHLMYMLRELGVE